MEPLRGGQITVNIPQGVQELFNQAEFKRSPAEWALRWVWNNPMVSVVLSGMNNMDDLNENIGTANKAQPNSLSENELKIITQAKNIFEEKLKINCTSCGYCLPCPAGVNIPENFRKYNDYYLFGSPETKERFQFVYNISMLNG